MLPSIDHPGEALVRAIVCCFLLLLSASAPAQNEKKLGYGHVTEESGWTEAPTASDTMHQRLEEAASDYAQYAPVPRIGFFDIAFPGSPSEFRATGGTGVMLVTVLSQDADELPAKRVYVSMDGEEYTLRLISVARTPPAPTGRVAQVLGPHRWDALYAFPVALMRDGATVTMDFAIRRAGFELGDLATQDDGYLGYPTPAGVAPVDDVSGEAALHALIAREYPGFLGPAL